MIPDRVMQWLAVRLGKRMEWNGPVVSGVGYLWCGKLWFVTKQEDGSQSQ